jgi:hypothetical protein
MFRKHFLPAFALVLMLIAAACAPAAAPTLAPTPSIPQTPRDLGGAG